MSSTGTASVTTPAALVAQLVAQLDGTMSMLAELASEGAFVELAPAARVETAELLHAVVDRGVAVATVSTQVVHFSEALEGTAYASTSTWLQTRCGRSRTEARIELARCHQFQGAFAATREEWLAGRVSTGAVAEITRGVPAALRSLPASERDEQAKVAQEVLLEVARVGTVADVARAVAHLRVVADPDGARQAEMDAYDDQQLSLRQVGAGFALTAYLAAEPAVALRTWLEREVDGWVRDGSLHPEDLPTGDDAKDARHSRTRRAHLLALALGELATRALDEGRAGTSHGVRPHLDLTVDVDRLLAGFGGELRVPGDAPVLLTSESVRRILCDSDVLPFVTLGGDGSSLDDVDGWSDESVPGWREALVAALREQTRTILWVGRTHRTTPPVLRRTVEVRDGHCAFSGCAVDPTRCEVHHVIPWEHGGSTDPANCVLLCRRHHHSVHEGGWTIAPDDGLDPLTTGYWVFSPPPRRDRPW